MPIIITAFACLLSETAEADDLFKPGISKSLASDQRASSIGDLVTIVIVQAAESSTSVRTNTQRSSAIDGRIDAGKLDESAGLTIGGSYNGRGEVKRSERFVTQITATIADILPSGDLLISGTQKMNINEETTLVEIRGRIRPADIDLENRVSSNRIADAQINYKGQGFISRSAKPGLIHRLFSLLGLS